MRDIFKVRARGFRDEDKYKDLFGKDDFIMLPSDLAKDLSKIKKSMNAKVIMDGMVVMKNVYVPLTISSNENYLSFSSKIKKRLSLKNNEDIKVNIIGNDIVIYK